MWWVGRTACFCVLLFLSYIDIRFRKVPVRILIVSNITSIIYYIIFKEINICLFAGGMGIGLVFIFISKITEEGMGFGDSWAILILGSYLGVWELLFVLAVSFSFLAVYAVVILCRRKMSRTCTIPFFPFLTGGYLAVFMMEGGIR